MPDMADAVDWTAIPTDVAAVAGYVDGPVSKWPAEAWAHFAGKPVLRVTVLANPDLECFDSEPGNAGTDAVAVAVAIRTARNQPSVVYTDESNLNALTSSFRMKSLRWLPASAWPTPGPYLWAAAPGTATGTVPTWCPVEPVAVQDRWDHTYDLSTLTGAWLPSVEPGATTTEPVATPVPAPPPAEHTYVTAPTSSVRFPRSVSYVPTPTLDDALAAMAADKQVFVWTTDSDSPLQVTSADSLRQLLHTGDHAFPQYVTYTAEPVD
ncbi:MAG: hypothetical protein ACYCZM_11975 [Acidimicrobiales bacterium]